MSEEITEVQAEPALVSTEEQQQADKARQEAEDILKVIEANSTILESSYVRLGSVLLTIRNERYWMLWGFNTFGSYMDSIKDRLGNKRTQLYQTISIAQTLLPLIGEEGLRDVGKSKAIELRRVVTATGRRPSDQLVTSARDPAVTVEKIRSMVHQEIHGDPPPDGSYRHIGGFWATQDEWLEIKQAMDLAKRVDPPIPNDISESEQIKQIMLKFARECYGQWITEVDHRD